MTSHPREIISLNAKLDLLMSFLALTLLLSLGHKEKIFSKGLKVVLKTFTINMSKTL